MRDQLVNAYKSARAQTTASLHTSLLKSQPRHYPTTMPRSMFKELPELKRRRKATIYIQLTNLTHFVSVTTTTDDWADSYSNVEQGRFELDDTLREAWEVFGMNYLWHCTTRNVGSASIKALATRTLGERSPTESP